MRRSHFVSTIQLGVLVVFFFHISLTASPKPNILLAISDDQSRPHTGAYGDKTVQTPAFDRLAGEGVLFTHAFCHASQCSPSRAALLTGRNIWQLEEAGTHASIFPKKFKVYTDILETHGYHIGYTGKPWAPGNWKVAGWSRNPVGPQYNDKELTPPSDFISSNDYAENFRAFLKDRPDGAPFHFWFGAHEPHRNYEPGSGIRTGKRLEDAKIPTYWPDNNMTRSDFLDYKLAIDWFDKQLGRILQVLEESGELENTLIVVTSDNGMPFPRAKANVYEHGARVPLAIRWGNEIPGNRVVNDLVSFIDLAPTFLEAAGIEPDKAITGKSLITLLKSNESGWVDPERNFVLLGKERHNYARPDNVGYPIRAIRTRDYLYIKNVKPDRWPLGNPPYYLCHTKMINPTKEFVLANAGNPFQRIYFDLIYNRRPAEELYEIRNDTDCIHNLATVPGYGSIRNRLEQQLNQLLIDQGDPRALGQGDIFESYPYYQGIPKDAFPGFKERGKYNPKFLSSKK